MQSPLTRREHVSAANRRLLANHCHKQ